MFVNDRLLAPNRDSTREAVKPELQEFLGKLFRGSEYTPVAWERSALPFCGVREVQSHVFGIRFAGQSCVLTSGGTCKLISVRLSSLNTGAYSTI